MPCFEYLAKTLGQIIVFFIVTNHCVFICWFFYLLKCSAENVITELQIRISILQTLLHALLNRCSCTYHRSEIWPSVNFGHYLVTKIKAWKYFNETFTKHFAVMQFSSVVHGNKKLITRKFIEWRFIQPNFPGLRYWKHLSLQAFWMNYVGYLC